MIVDYSLCNIELHDLLVFREMSIHFTHQLEAEVNIKYKSTI